MTPTLALVIVVVLAAGLALGGLAALRIARRRELDPASIVDELRRTAEDQQRGAEAQRDAAIAAALHQLDTMNRAVLESERTRGAQELDGKKSLIDQQLQAMTGKLSEVSQLVQTLERDRAMKFGELASQLQQQREGIAALVESTQGLRQALSSSKARGQWGERMAEDVLRLAGLIENVNYRKQRAIEGGGVPDYTFMLPQGMSLHMDVKFPLDNYLRYLEAESDTERERYRKEFLRDVRNRLKELGGRGYVNTGDGTVDCMLLFIPNEQVYAFINEQDRTILDDAMHQKIVFCSPLTLYAVLAVIRQAVDNFRLERTSKEILALLHGFAKQWEKFVEQMDKVGRNLKTAHHAFEDLEGTRRRQLERQLDKVEALRSLEEQDADGELVLGDAEHDRPLALEA